MKEGLEWRDGSFSIDPERSGEFIDLLRETNKCEINHDWYRMGPTRIYFSAKFIKTSITYRLWIPNDERRKLIRDYHNSDNNNK